MQVTNGARFHLIINQVFSCEAFTERWGTAGSACSLDVRCLEDLEITFTGSQS